MPWKGGVPFRVEFGRGALSPLLIKKCHQLQTAERSPNLGLEKELEREATQPRFHIKVN